MPAAQLDEAQAAHGWKPEADHVLPFTQGAAVVHASVRLFQK